MSNIPPEIIVKKVINIYTSFMFFMAFYADYAFIFVCDSWRPSLSRGCYEGKKKQMTKGWTKKWQKVE